MAVFSIIDHLVLDITLLISAAIGIYSRFSGGKQQTTKEYLLGNQNQRILPVAFSLMASFMSAVTLLGVSAETYNHGFIFVLINFSYIIGTPVVTNIFLPVFFNLGAISVYEYLERRFGFATRLACSLAFTFQMMLYTGIVLYAPALALEAVTGLSQRMSILIVGLCCLFYSTVGGIKAVIWTDVFQSLLMYGALLAVIFVAAAKFDGVSGIWKIAEEHGRINLYNPSLDLTERHSWLALTVGGFFTFLSLYAINQTQIQRYLTMQDLNTATKSLWLSLPLLMFLSFATCFCGLSIFAMYHNCDPISTKRIASKDQLMPLFVIDTMQHLPGLSGLFVAGIFSASLSSVSAAINSLAAVTVQDFIKPLHSAVSKGVMLDSTCSYLLKALVLLFGILCIGVAYLTQFFGSILQMSLTLFGVIGGPVLAVFTMGVLNPYCNQKGALTGLFLGLIFSFWLGFSGPKPIPQRLSIDISGCANSTLVTINDLTNEISIEEDSTTVYPLTDEQSYSYLFRISYLYYIVLGFFSTAIVAVLVSLVTEANKNLNPSLYAPCIEKYVRRYQSKRQSKTVIVPESEATQYPLDKIEFVSDQEVIT
nr:PREDICTED: putative sodium-dependent multivitamin transporter isoform X1 [Bemisia tabaci]XP_018902471.1 PREDICTED: putative sodium-dependent multivitamin transporter isoform X1 [Bemisia tabaci]XP_018902472.1 PREDICTED: putative sodium-dependent multivitamin transporter isoform X1 [Bemisia tabaci]